MYKPNPNTIVEIPLSLIEVDDNWNCRSGKWEVNDGDEEGQQFDDLVLSIREKGQEVPCDVRIHPENPERYQLIAGFRRARAKKKIAAEDKVDGILRCIVIAADDIQARLRNISENTTRQNITIPDIAWGIHELHKAAIVNGRPMSVGQIARMTGKSESYVSHLLTIMTKCKPAIVKRWRSMPKSIGVRAMHSIALLAKSDQDAAFELLLMPGSSADPTKESTKYSSWSDNAKRKAYSVGVMLGQLEGSGCITTTGLDFVKHIRLMVTLRDGCTVKQRDMIVDEMVRGYELGKQRDPILRDE